jgi:hypothetical protein
MPNTRVHRHNQAGTITSHHEAIQWHRATRDPQYQHIAAWNNWSSAIMRIKPISCSSICEPQSVRQPILLINCTKLSRRSTMARGAGPPPPLGDHPNGVDVSHPTYAIDSVNRHEPPKQFSKNYMNTASMTLRTTNDSYYKIIGNATTWNRFVLFGFHAYDHCFQFDTQWKCMSQNQTDTLIFIWEGYSYLLSHGKKIPKKMELWAIDIARPYLQIHLISALTVNTTDPRSTRRIYDEDELMQGADSVDTTIPASKWTPVLGKRNTESNPTHSKPLCQYLLPTPRKTFPLRHLRQGNIQKQTLNLTRQPLPHQRKLSSTSVSTTAHYALRSAGSPKHIALSPRMMTNGATQLWTLSTTFLRQSRTQYSFRGRTEPLHPIVHRWN